MELERGSPGLPGEGRPSDPLVVCCQREWARYRSALDDGQGAERFDLRGLLGLMASLRSCCVSSLDVTQAAGGVVYIM